MYLDVNQTYGTIESVPAVLASRNGSRNNESAEKIVMEKIETVRMDKLCKNTKQVSVWYLTDPV